MKRQIITILVAVFLATTSVAQNIDVRRIEGEIAFGLASGISALEMDDCDWGPRLTGELRYNIKSLPVDVGLQFSASNFYRSVDGIQNDRLKFNSCSVMAVADYNFRRGEKVSFFAGAGLGYAYGGTTEPQWDAGHNWGGYATGEEANRLGFAPRVGIELWNHLRLTATYTIFEKYNNNLAISLGVVFGGGRKK